MHMKTCWIAALTIPAVMVVATSAIAADQESRRFKEPPFSAVELIGPDSITIVPGSQQEVVARGDPRALAKLDISVSDGTLRVSRKKERRWRNDGDKGAHITVTVPDLRAVRLTGAGDMDVGRFRRATFSAALMGAGDLSIRGLYIRQGSFTLSGAGNLSLTDLTARRASLVLNGTGNLDASGTAGQVEMQLGGTGEIDAGKLVSDNATASLGGTGSIEGYARNSATISVGGTGSIHFSGHPRCTISKSGLGSASCD